MKNVRLLLGVAIVSFALLPGLAETRTVYAEDHDGMTPIQQLTNAVASAVEGDVIELKRGTYVFPDDVYMADNGRAPNSYCKFRLNVTAPGITIRGEDDSNRKTWTHESEPVVIDGNGGKAIQVQLADNKGVRIENIAFANCNGGANGDDSLYGNWCDGGAIGVGRVAGGSGDRGGGHKTVISNCVFRSNSAALGGAVGGFKNTIKVQDCYFTNNVATSMGGCLYFCYATGCDFVGNGSVGAYMYDVTDSRLVANKPKSSQIVLDVWTGTSSAVSNCIFEANEFPSDINNYIARATRFENCHFTNNVTARSGMVNAAGAVLTNCTFHGNRMLRGGVVVNAANLLDCRITSTSGGNSSAVMIDNAKYRCYVKDCYFGDNVSSQGGAGAYMALNCSSLSAADLAEPIMTFDHCTFEANAVDNGKHGGAILNGCTSLPSGVSLESLVVCSNDCRFTRNAAPHACGVEGVTAMGCKFIDNRLGDGFNYLGGDAALSRLVDCDLTGGNLYKCSVDRCRVHEVTSCGAFNVGCHVTNTLVFGCVFANKKDCGVIGRYNYAEAAAVPSEFVNCTFAANSGNFFASTNIVSLVNCAFFDNTNRLGEASAVSFHDAEDNNGAITFDHCAFGPLSSVDISGVADNSQFDVNPKFVEAPPWSPSRKSPLCEAGLVQSWMDTAADLVGNPRIKAGKVDIGCYECWLREPGLILIFK